MVLALFLEPTLNLAFNLINLRQNPLSLLQLRIMYFHNLIYSLLVMYPIHLNFLPYAMIAVERLKQIFASTGQKRLAVSLKCLYLRHLGQLWDIG